MSKQRIVSRLALGLLGGVLIGVSQLAAAQFLTPSLNANRTDNRDARVVLQPRIMMAPAEQERAQSYADQGIDALRQYVWRTRTIYSYYMPDLLSMPGNP